MKRIFTLLSALAFTIHFAMAGPFTPGNFVVVRVGTGTGALSGSATAVFLDEYTTAGILVQSIPMPTADDGTNQTLTLSGTSTSDGSINLSSDRAFLTLAGYDAAPGTASVTSTLTGGTTPTVRVIGRVSATGDIDTRTTTTSFSANNIRSAVTTDGTGFWAVGANTGVVYQPLAGSGTGTTVSTTITNNRTVGIFGGQLYISTASGTAVRIGSVGTGLPTTTNQTITNIPGYPSTGGSPYTFIFFDENPAVAGVDVLYVADDGTAGISKYSFDGTNWVANGNIAGAYRGLTGTLNAGVVTLIATGTATSANTIVRLVDVSGYNATITGIPTTIATAATNTVFRGVSVTPGTIILPLQLLSFSAVPKENTVTFNWKTTNERNTHHFEIEQSLDGINFTSIATIAAAGNTTAEKSYNYTGSLNGTLTYYRLKSVDTDGKFTTSSVVKIIPSQTGFSLGNVYPVPAKNNVTVEWNNKVAGTTALTLTDMNGRTVRTINLKGLQGFNQYQVDLSTLAPGQYFLRLKNGTQQLQTIITKQ